MIRVIVLENSLICEGMIGINSISLHFGINLSVDLTVHLINKSCLFIFPWFWYSVRANLGNGWFGVEHVWPWLACLWWPLSFSLRLFQSWLLIIEWITHSSLLERWLFQRVHHLREFSAISGVVQALPLFYKSDASSILNCVNCLLCGIRWSWRMGLHINSTVKVFQTQLWNYYPLGFGILGSFCYRTGWSRLYWWQVIMWALSVTLRISCTIPDVYLRRSFLAWPIEIGSCLALYLFLNLNIRITTIGLPVGIFRFWLFRRICGVCAHRHSPKFCDRMRCELTALWHKVTSELGALTARALGTLSIFIEITVIKIIKLSV